MIVGSRMHCPKCMVLQDVLAFKPLGMSENFTDELAPILKCRRCNWIFAPASVSLGELLPINSEEPVHA